MISKDKPLVSIILVTYNSSKYVLEALESIYEQSYENIELVITDDCSTDNTIELCKNWMITHKDRLMHTELITSTRNTGITPNVNRGLAKIKGKWVRLIAGDDILAENSINQYVQHSKLFARDDVMIVSFVDRFQNDNISIPNPEFQLIVDSKLQNIMKFLRFNSNNKLSILSAENQLFLFLKGKIPGHYFNGVFYNSQILQKMNGFNEEYPFLEDVPMILKLLQSGYCFYQAPFVGYRQRVHTESISRGHDGLIISVKKYMRECLLPVLLKKRMLIHYWNYYLEYRYFYDSRRVNFVRLLVDPIYIQRFISSQLSKILRKMMLIYVIAQQNLPKRGTVDR
jgi:glycosyltransferase involved in cell wall biosynthesis